MLALQVLVSPPPLHCDKVLHVKAMFDKSASLGANSWRMFNNSGMDNCIVKIIIHNVMLST